MRNRSTQALVRPIAKKHAKKITLRETRLLFRELYGNEAILRPPKEMLWWIMDHPKGLRYLKVYGYAL